MRKVKTLAAVLTSGALLAGGAAYGDSHKNKDPLAEFERTGKMENCLETYRIEQTNVLDDKTIIFETTGGDYYLNKLPHNCPQLGFEERFSYTLRGLHQLCNVDIITVMTTTGPGASCGLGKFEKIVKKEKK